MTKPTELPKVISIDPRGARELDDAIAAIRTEHGWRVDVCVPDVPALLMPGSLEDVRAREMGATRYSGNAVREAMLPHYIVDALTLSPNRDAPMIHIVIALAHDLSAKVVAIRRLVHRTAGRLTYEEADRAIVDTSHPHHTKLAALWQLASLLHTDRSAATGAMFDTSRHIFTDEEGKQQSLPERDAHRSNMTVMEIMILANSALADHALCVNAPILYRNHVLEGLTRGDRASAAAQIALRDGMGRHAAARAMRAMAHLAQAATMGVEALGHHGLDVRAYTWLTSPLRRFTDVIGWRALVDGIAEPDLAATAEAQTALIREQKQASADFHGQRHRRRIISALAAGDSGTTDEYDLHTIMRALGENPSFDKKAATECIGARMLLDNLSGRDLAAIEDNMGTVISEEAAAIAKNWIAADPARIRLLQRHRAGEPVDPQPTVITDNTAKKRLDAFAGGDGGIVVYSVVQRQGPPHSLVFTVRAVWTGKGREITEEAQGTSIRAAEHAAAEKILAHLGKDLHFTKVEETVSIINDMPPKSALLEIGVKQGAEVVFSKPVVTGPDHQPAITSTVTWKAPGVNLTTTATAGNRREAERLASLKMVELVRNAKAP